MTATHAAVRRRPSAREEKGRRPRGADVATATGVTQADVRIQHLDRIAIHASSDDRAGFLLDAAAEQPAQALPYAETLERRFGQRLDWVRVRQGPLVTDVLDTLGARAATRGCDIFLREASAPLDVVSHEVTHALQVRRGGTGPAGVVAEDAAPEVEAAQALHAPVRPAEGLAPGAIALLRMGSPTDPAPTITVQPPAVLSPPATTTTTDTAPAPSEPAPESDVPTSPIQAHAAGSGTTTGAGEELVAAPLPEVTVSPEAMAAREAEVAEAEAGLAGAASADQLLQAFATAPPTVKARQAASLNDQLAAIVPAETEQWQAEVPTIDASLEGEGGAPPEPLRVEAPAGQVELEPEAAAPAPAPEIAEVPAAEPFTANDAVTGAFGRLNEPPPEQFADAIGDTLEAVQTTDPSVPRSPGPPPQIPLGGETDPARIAGQEETATSQAAQLGDDAGQAVVEGPGPEQVQPTSVHEPYAVEAVEPPAAPTLVVPEGPAEFLALELPPEVQLTFDEQQQTAMQESMAEATASADQATAARDSARDEAVATAQQGADELNEQAQSDQTAAVVDARTTIQTERQSTVDAQHAEVERVRGEASERRQADEGVIDDQVALEQQAIDDSYVAAESDIDNQVTAAEDKARAERERAEKEAEDESWWDRAVDFVKDAFDSLVSLIGDIFDAVRAAVNAALDAVKAFALSVIDRLATFVKDAIAAYGEFLKFAVDALIGEVFPELAEALNSAIDVAVETAQAAVDVVADGLKAGISALVEGLRAGINAALDAYEAAISFAVSVVGAALTGDWGLVARKILEAVLKLVGVDPEAFYAFVGRAQETFDIIVDDPLGFLSNIVDAVVGGVQGFADRFGEHLKKGVIEWLTGTLGGAGIVLPPAFDLVGVLDLARQILGLTWERIRAKAVTLIGEQNVARLEFIGGYITTLVNEGWGALWEKLKADVGGLLDMVFDGIKSFLLERVVMAMIKKIPALFGPAGAIVQLVMTAWNLYTFLRDQLSRLGALVRSVVDTIGDIARGVLTAAVAKVEEVLGSLVPLALDLLARLLGLGNLGEDVRKVVDKVQAFIDKAIDGLIARVLALFTGQGTAGAAAPDGAAPAGAEAAAGTDPAVGQLHDTFDLAGEEHSIRAVGAEGDASIQLASGEFGDLVNRISDVVGGLKRDYTTSGGAKYVGDADAPPLEQQLDSLVSTARTIVDGVLQEKDKVKERALILAGIKSLRTLSTQLNKQLGISATSGASSPGVSAPGIGDVTVYGAKPPGHRSGPKIHHTEAEHLIPYKIGDSLLAVADLSTGSRRASPKFDKAMWTLVIYKPAADEKTAVDQTLIKDFGSAVAAHRIRDRLVGSVMREQGGGGDEESDGHAAYAELVSALQAVRDDAVERTQQAIVHDHEAITEGGNVTNGFRRGEKSSVPDGSAVQKTAVMQYEQLFELATTLVAARGDQPIRPEAPERTVIPSVSLAELNQWSESQLMLVKGIGPKTAKRLKDYIAANGEFATRSQVFAVPDISQDWILRP